MYSHDTIGRCIFCLPLNSNPSQLGDSSSFVKRMFKALEHKFVPQAAFKQKYVEFMIRLPNFWPH